MSEARQYELVYVVSPEVTDEGVTELHERIAEIVGQLGGKIDKTDNWGRRRLAYEINRHREGSYVIELITGPGTLVTELERRLRVMEQLLRYLVVRVDEDLRKAQRARDQRQSRQQRRLARKAPTTLDVPATPESAPAATPESAPAATPESATSATPETAPADVPAAAPAAAAPAAAAVVVASEPAEPAPVAEAGPETPASVPAAAPDSAAPEVEATASGAAASEPAASEPSGPTAVPATAAAASESGSASTTGKEEAAETAEVKNE